MKYIDKIIHGDCIEILKEIPDRSIDLVILDPPYWKVGKRFQSRDRIINSSSIY